jgi:hypothetical protein
VSGIVHRTRLKENKEEHGLQPLEILAPPERGEYPTALVSPGGKREAQPGG